MTERMTVQELINELSKVEDKTKQVYYRDSRPDHPLGDKRDIEIIEFNTHVGIYDCLPSYKGYK